MVSRAEPIAGVELQYAAVIGVGLGLLVATIWPFLHVFVPLGVPLAERWLYLPSAGCVW